VDSKVKCILESLRKKLHRAPTIQDLVDESLNQRLSSDDWIAILKAIYPNSSEQKNMHNR